MAKSKRGPPYSGRSAEYVVVIRPWGMSNVSRNRVSKDFDRLGAWIQYILHEKDIDAGVECIYTMGSRDEVIVQLPYGTDIQPLLGEHKWALIVRKWDGRPNDPSASYIFEYNFRNNGDPGNHNWAEQFPDTQGISVPAKSPYPTPGWTEPPNSIRSLVFPIPPRPSPEPESAPNLAASFQDASPPHPCIHAIALSSSNPVPESPSPPVNNTSSFRPYEPPTQHPAHGTFINQTNQPSTSAHQHNRQINRPAKEENLANMKYIKKLDPYQEEEDAKAFLSISPQDPHSDYKPLKQEPVKSELTDTDYEHKYRPSSELMDAIDSLIQGQNEDHKAPLYEGPSMTEPRPGPSSYQPSTELVDEINSLIHEQVLDKKPSIEEAKRTRDPRQKPHYQPSVELTDVINTLLQQSASSIEEQKLVLDPRPQKRRKIEEGHSGV